MFQQHFKEIVLELHNTNFQKAYLDQNDTTSLKGLTHVTIFHLNPHIYLPSKHLPRNTDLSKNREFGIGTAQYSPALKGSVNSGSLCRHEENKGSFVLHPASSSTTTEIVSYICPSEFSLRSVSIHESSPWLSKAIHIIEKHLGIRLHGNN